MPFQNRLQYDKQWDITIPIIICTFLGLVAQIDLLIRVTIFWNLPNRNFNTFIAQFTFTSHDESWENLFIDIHIDRERSNRANPTPGRSLMSDTLQHVRNQRSHPPAPREPHEETSDEETNTTEKNRSCNSRGDTVTNTPKRPTTPLEHMEEDNMQRLHPAFPSNADLIAAGDSGIELTKEQHRILTSQSE